MTVKIMLLTQKELEDLPCWAVVAFAARCARRSLPLYQGCGNIPLENTQAVENAVSMAEDIAAKGTCEESQAAELAAREAEYAARAAEASLKDKSNSEDDAKAAAHAARAAEYAARAAGRAHGKDLTQNAARVTSRFAAKDAERAAIYSHFSLEALDAKSSSCAAMRQDYNNLRQAVEKEHWTMQKSVLPDFFGSLWPDGTPKGLP